MILKIASIDDNPFDLERLRDTINYSAKGHQTQLLCTGCLEEFYACLPAMQPDCVLIDINLGLQNMTGFDVIRETRRRCGDRVLIYLYSNSDDPRTIEEGMRLGANDYISKDTDPNLIYSILVSAKMQRDAEQDETPKSATSMPPKVAGKSMRAASDFLRGILKSPVRALHIQGESGVGKEVMVDLLESLIAPKPVVRINCGAIAPQLLHSSLFGHVRGAYTGAGRDELGYIEQASGGWLFLDEVATLAPESQVALLRVIENQTFMRLGSAKEIRVNVRFASATNENIESYVAQGKFRADLWNRLRDASWHIVPLRERRDEIPDLIDSLMKTLSPERPFLLLPAAKAVLCQLDWRDGNVRALKSCLMAMMASAHHSILSVKDIPKRHFQYVAESVGASLESARTNPTKPPAIAVNSREAIDRMIVEQIRQLGLTTHGLTLRRIEEITGLSKSALSRTLRRAVATGLIAEANLPIKLRSQKDFFH